MLAFLLLACAAPVPPPANATVPPPWSTYDLPLDDAVVVSASAHTLHLHLRDAEPQPGPWVQALEGHGWEGQFAGVHDPELRDVVLVDPSGATLQLGFRADGKGTALTLAWTSSPRAVTP